MRAQDFLDGALKDLKFRVSFPGEVVTTQENIDGFAIEFSEWLNVNTYKYPTKTTTKELLEIYKKEKGL